METQVLIEGGPNPPGSPTGTLVGYLNSNSNGPVTGALPGTDPADTTTNHEIGQPYTGANACTDIIQLEGSVDLWNLGPKAPYAFLPVSFLPAYNSNSFTHTLLQDVGLGSWFGALPGWVPGWNKLVPGL